jgi:CRP/FNR family cyclic AMP-dependent transcriptional regulator
MDIKPIHEIVAEQPFFAELERRFQRLVGGCASNARFRAGEYLFHEGGGADRFYIVRHGRVALEVKAPGKGALTLGTLGEGEIVGVSWLVPPYRWSYDARALEEVRAIAMDAACLRGKCEADHDLGYEMMKRFMPILIQRLQSARLQMLDVYGES